MATSKPIHLFTPEGEAVKYRRLSDRLPDFLSKFSPEKGYRVEVEYFDPLEVKPGLRQLYQTAIQAGVKPSDVDLPEIKSGGMLFRATLYSPEGQKLASGSAFKPIVVYKDWEKGETAARQRLLAALGFGGEVLDEDETGDQQDQGLSPINTNTEEPMPAPVQEVETHKQPESEQGNGIPASLLRQIEHQASLKKVPVPKVSTVEEAKAALQNLLQG